MIITSIIYTQIGFTSNPKNALFLSHALKSYYKNLSSLSQIDRLPPYLTNDLWMEALVVFSMWSTCDWSDLNSTSSTNPLE